MIIPMAINAGPWTLPSQGRSSAARYASEEAEGGLNRLRNSVVYSMPFEDVSQTYVDCNNVGWDGYNAQPVTAASRLFAMMLLRSLPLGVAPPEVSAEPDGELTLEWSRSPRRTLSVSISPKGELHYAALIGTSRNFGSEPFFGDIPTPIITLIHRVMAL